MATRTVAQVAAGVLAGAVLAGVPTYAVASQDDGASGKQEDMSQMMSGSESNDQMMTSMMKMMKDPGMRKEMTSMMSEVMGEMPGMGDMSDMGAGKGGKGMSGMGQMPGTDSDDTSPGATKR